MADSHGTLLGLLGRVLTAGAEMLAAAGLRRWFLRRALPPANEALHLPECAGPVTIRYDRWGVPHIRASSAADLFLAQGYCHARDRFWQMELGRRVSRGELAELLGERAIELDRIFRRLGFHRAAQDEAATVDEEIRTALTAYTVGVNAYLSRHPRPIEFLLLQHTPRPWSVVDSLALARYIAWNLTFGWETQLIRARLADALGPERAAALEPRPLPTSQAGPLGAGQTAGPQGTGLGLGSGLGGAMGSGASNNWAVAPERSATRAAILANDPHLRPRIPAAWHVAHLHGGGYNVAGATMPGIIGVLIGHNERVAWGVTVAVADCQEIYVEKLHPDRPHVFADGPDWYEATVQRECIHVRKRPPLVEEVVRTRHGPLLNGVLGIPAGGPPLSLRSTTDTGHCSTRALLDLNRAADWPTFRAALARWNFPTLNFIYADVDGTIATKMVGQVPIRAADNGSLPVPGWDRQHEWTGTLSFDDLPEIVNPEEGILATANSEPDVPCPHFLTRDFMDDGRKRRIMQLLRSRDRHSLDDMQSMHMDLVSLPARAIAAQLCRALDSAANPELTYLAGWDGSLDAASVPATIYEVFREQLRRRVFRDLPLSIHALLHGQGTHEPLGYLGSVFHSQATSLVVRLVNELLATESGTAIVSEAFRATIAWLRARLGPDPARWQWGRLHRIGFTHVLGRGVPLLDRLLRLSRGPFPAGGDGDTIAHCGVDPWHPFDGGMFSVSYRQLFDLGDWDAARFILPTGQSGHPGSPHYDDMVKAWLRGEYRPLLFSGEAIDRASVGTISIGPSSASHSRSSHLTAPGSPGEK